MSLVELERHADPMLGQIVRGRLEAAGIPAFCFDSGMNIAEGAPLLFQVRVMVLEEDLERRGRCWPKIAAQATDSID